MPDRLTVDTIDAELAPGAHNAVSVCLQLTPDERVTIITVCLQLTPDERVTIITDEATRDIAAALRLEVEAIGSEHSIFILENYASRPLTAMPQVILDDLAQSHVSIFCAQSQPGELPSRMQMSDVVNKRHIRHGHMVNINRQIMREGMRADFRQVDALSRRLIERARHAERITCRTPHGTDFEADFSPKLKWLKTSGIITPEKWGNLPGGEIFTAPANTDGTFVVDGVVGDYLCSKYGDLRDAPLTINVADNRIVDLRSENKELLDDFRAYTSTDENSNRVANWVSKTHIDCVGRDFDIWFDGEQVMRAGKFLV